MASRISWVPMPSLALARIAPAAVEADDVFDLAAGFLGLRAGQVDLVDDRDDLEVAVDGEVHVGQRLRFHALARIDQQQRAFARGQRPGDLVREVHVARRVDQVQDVLLPVVGRVVQADRVGLDGDAALALEVHGVQDLGLHLAGLERPGVFEEAVGQRGLAVVDVRDDREIPDVLLVQRLGSGRRRKAGPSLCQRREGTGRKPACGRLPISHGLSIPIVTSHRRTGARQNSRTLDSGDAPSVTRRTRALGIQSPLALTRRGVRLVLARSLGAVLGGLVAGAAFVLRRRRRRCAQIEWWIGAKPGRRRTRCREPRRAQNSGIVRPFTMMWMG